MMTVYTITAQGTPRGCHAFKNGSDITFSLSVSDMSCQNIWFYIGNDEKVIMGREVPVENRCDGFHAEITLNTKELEADDGLYFCHFEFISDGKRFYTAFDNNENCYLADHFVNEIQLLVYNEKYETPSWIDGGVVYQIFPDRFARGGDTVRREDAVYNDDWENGIPEHPERAGDSFPNNTHFGGTLYGVVDKLDYLQGLGVNCIYLNPIFEAYSCHKYDTADFLSVDRSFGGDEALQTLIDKAHERGMKIVLDGVFNHVGNDSIYFDAYGKYGNGACSNPDSPYFGWFTFNQYPHTYESWWGITNLPRIVRCESYRRFITEQVIPKYMRMGVDGWRLDVVDELEGDFLEQIVSAIKSYKSDAIVVGEVWEDASNKIAYNQRKAYFRGKQLDSVTNYPVKNAIVDFIKYGDARSFAETVDTLYRHYPPHKLAGLFNYLGSHDTERIATVLGGIPEHELEYKQLATTFMPSEVREQTKELLKQAYLLLASLPGVPCIFYGDEIAMEGYRDPFNRRTFPESGFDDEMSRFFAKVNNIRRNEPLFTAERLIVTHNENGVVKLARIMGDKSLLVFANMSNEAYEAVHAGGKAVDLINGTEYTDKVTIPAKKVIILKTEK